LKVNYEGCAICGSTWGDLWEEVDGQRLFFCCATCVRQFRGLVERVKSSTGWERIDELQIEGDRRGRTCLALRSGEPFRFFIAFDPEGSVWRFRRLGPADDRPSPPRAATSHDASP
jgi:hypothetical protein